MTSSPASAWWVYLILTDSQHLYTGIATDPARRFNEHEATFEGTGSKGAKFFRGKKPLKVIYQETAQNRSEATRREMAIKKMSKQQKWRLINSKDQQSK